MKIPLASLSNTGTLLSLVADLAPKKVLSLRRTLEKDQLEGNTGAQTSTLPLKKIILKSSGGKLTLGAELASNEAEGLLDILAQGLSGEEAGALDAQLFKTLVTGKKDKKPPAPTEKKPAAVATPASPLILALPAQIPVSNAKGVAGVLAGVDREVLLGIKRKLLERMSNSAAAASDSELVIKGELQRSSTGLQLLFAKPAAAAIAGQMANLLPLDQAGKLDIALTELVINA